MAPKTFFLTFVFGMFSMILSAQEETPAENELDSVQTALKQDGIVFQDSIVKKKNYINPLAPSRAAFYSAVVPGLGQAYNKKYWKVPIVFGAIGAGVYAYTFYNDQYQTFRDVFKRRKAGFFDDQFINTIPAGDDRLERLQNAKQSERDLALLVTIIIYALNVVDANVDAHLKQFNIDDELSWDMNLQPYLESNPINNNPNYGMALTITF